MPNTTVQTVTAALEAARRLAELRRSQCDCFSATVTAERDLAYEKALAEKSLIDAAGGEANLGKNEAARERAFTLGLCDAKQRHYAAARNAHDEADAERRLVDVDVKLAADQLTILVAALNAGILEIDVALLADPVADQSAPQVLWPDRVMVFTMDAMAPARADTTSGAHASAGDA
jgi:hypothetical protein